MMHEAPKTANEMAFERTELAVERTVMAANRTLQAWIRTALSLISFGFTIYKILLSAGYLQNCPSENSRLSFYQ